jgi:DNA-directed RNA polymerase specialized sigma24 family protein
LTLKWQLREVVPVLESSAGDRISFYVRAARYRRLLYFVAHRVLGNPDRAVIAVENCLFSAARHVATFDHEGAFRNWLVRLAFDESLAILHGKRMPEHRHENEEGGIKPALVSSQRNAL